MAEPAIATDFLDPTLVARAQRYEPDAVAQLCDRSLDVLHRVCLALAGEEAAAEHLAGGALLKALDGLPTFGGDSAAFHIRLLRLAVGAAAKRRPPGTDVRESLTHLSNFDYELVAMRVLAEIDFEHLSPALNAEPASLRAWLVTGLRELDGRSGTGWGPDLRAFDGAVQEVIEGADPEHAGTGLSAPGDAQRLLELVAGLRRLIGEPMAPAAAIRLRTTMLAAAAERRVTWVQRNHGVATVPGIERRRYPTRYGPFVTLGVAAVLAVIVGVAMAVLSSFASPTSSFYSLKLTSESALIAVAIDPVDRAQLEIKLAQTREREAEDMAGRGDGDRTVEALDRRYELLRAAGHDLLSVSIHDARWRAARDELFKKSDVQVAGIERDLQDTGQQRSKQDVERLVDGFNQDRQAVEAELGRKPAQPGQDPGAAGPPVSPPP